MKKILTTAISLLCSLSIASAPITPEDALSRIMTDGPMRSVSTVQPELRFSESVDGLNCLYVFSRGKDRGFVIASADDTSVPVLGFSDSGTLPENKEELPESLRSILSMLASEVAANAAESTNDNLLVCGSAQRHNIEPMCRTQWGNRYPYDSFFPQYNANLKFHPSGYTVAIAQILKYFNYPDIGYGQANFTIEPYFDETFDFSQTAFDWDNMLARYDGSESQTEIDAVAQLLWGCGIAMNAADDVYVDNIPLSIQMLVENLDYDKGIRLEYRDEYDSNSWDNMIFAALRDSGPVILTPKGVTFTNAFLCDGYKNGYFHINWCYGGVGDGYYLLSALNPDVMPDDKDFAMRQVPVLQAITGITPNRGSDDYIRGVDLLGDVFVRYNTINTTETQELIKLSVDIENFMVQCYPDADITLGIRATPLSGGVSYEAYETESRHVKGYYPNFNTGFSTTAFNELEAGSYMLTPICKVAGIEQPFECKSFNRFYAPFLLTIENTATGGRTASVTNCAEGWIEITDFKLEDPLYKDNLFRLSATITNKSSEKAFYGRICAQVRATESSLNLQYRANGDTICIALEPDESRILEYTSGISTIYQGEDIFVPCTAYVNLIGIDSHGGTTVLTDGNQIKTEFTRCEQAELSISDLNIEDNQDCWNLKATATLTVPSGYFAGTLPLKIYDKETGDLVGTFQTDYIRADARDSDQNITIPLEWRFLFNNGVDGKSYLAHVWPTTYESPISNEEEFMAGVGTGIERVITNPASPDEQTDYFTITGIHVDRPGKGIYIVRRTMSDGSVTTTKTVIH